MIFGDTILLLKTWFNIKRALPLIYLVLGVVCGMICIFNNLETDHPRLYKVLWAATDILLVSALLSFLMTTAKYIGVFKEAVNEIVYDFRFLSNRKDIEKVWERVSVSLFNAKFPNISHDFLETIRKYYIPINEDHFYDNYRAIIDIQWLNKDQNWIKIKYGVDYTLNTDSIEENKFTFNSWTNISENEVPGSVCSSKTVVLKYLVDGESIDLTRGEESIQDGEKIETFHVTLKGKQKYAIRQEIEKTMCLDYDNFCAFNCKWLVNNMDIQVFFPSDMSVNFVAKGTVDKFKVVNKRENSLRYEYKGLILRSQGYLFILTKK